MKPAIKIGSLLLAVMMLFSVVFASGCSFSKEWSYKTADKELPIGVYIYSLNSAYNQALSLAQDQLGDEYDGTKDTWLDKEIEDEDGNKAVARQWIKDKAEEMCLSYLAIEQQLAAEGASVDSASLEAAESQAKEYWEVGPYASYNYIMPYKDQLEPLGISYDSFKYCTAEYSVNYSALFAALYEEGGSQAVSDSELQKYVEDNYVDYTYFTVDLNESTTDEAGESTTVALSDDEIKKINDELNGYVKDIENGKSIDDVVEAYMTANALTESPAISNTEQLENTSLGDEVKEAVEKLGSKKATTVQVGEGDTAIVYFVYKNEIKDASADYIADASNRASALNSMKTEDFDAYIKEAADKLDYEKSSAVDKYDPKMFFVAEEPTTAAEEDAEESEASDEL